MKLSLDPAALAQFAHAAPSTRASLEAKSNYAANLAALRHQTDMCLPENPSLPDCTWTYARDSALSARSILGQWLSGCSVPRRLAHNLLRKLQVTGSIACFLAPNHAAQLEFALRILEPTQAIIALIPSADDLLPLLHCCNFAPDITAHRLYFVFGQDWPAQLSSLLQQVPGLVCPQCFIRTPLLHDAQAQALTTTAHKVIQAESARRATLLPSLRTHRPDGPLCLLAPSHFRLWDDAPIILAECFSGPGVLHLDPDNPSQSSHLALAQAASRSRAIITANLTRADLPPDLLDHIPIVSWLTTARIPRWNPAFPHDALVLATPDLLRTARAAHWPSSRLATAPYPPLASARPDSAQTFALSLLSNTRDPSPAQRAFDLSSHRLLWELILDEISSNPLSILPDPSAYLANRSAQLNISPDSLDRRAFLNDLILPAFQQTIARTLLRNNIPLSLFGNGWLQLPEFVPHAHGPLTSRAQFLSVAASSAALLHAWPSPAPHPIESLARPLLRVSSSLLSHARQLLSSPPAPRRDSQPPLLSNAILDLLPIPAPPPDGCTSALPADWPRR